MPSNRWFYSIKTLFSSKKSLSFFTIAIVILSIPLTVFLVQLQQDIRQRAQQATTETVEQPDSDVILPWQYKRSSARKLPVISSSTKKLLTTTPYSSDVCAKKSQGDADCNDTIDIADVSYWQADFESGTTKFGDFNRDKIVDLSDYAIWRQHANIPKQSIIQKISKTFGLDTWLSFIPWKTVPRLSWKVFAQTGSATEVVNSTITNGNGTFQVVTQYSNEAYGVANIATGTNQSQAIYYTNTGQQIAQVSNFLSGNSTAFVQIGNATVAVSHESTGPVIQTSQDENGAIIASQVWPNQAAFERNEPPSAATVPTTQGFASLSIQPNNAAILLQRDVNGNVISGTMMDKEGMIATTDYKNRMAVMASGSTGLSFANFETDIGMSSLIFYAQKLIGATKKNNKSGEVQTAYVSTTGSWTITTYDRNGTIVSQNTITDITSHPDPAFPDLATIIEKAKNYRPPTVSTQFTQAFQSTSEITRQTAAADALVAVSNAQAVLGARTVVEKSRIKSVLGSTSTDVPLSSPVSLPGGTATQVEVTISSWEPSSGPNAGTTVYAASVTPLDSNHQPVGATQTVISDTSPVTTAPNPVSVAQDGGYSPSNTVSGGGQQPAPQQPVAQEPAAQQPAAQPATGQQTSGTQVTVNGVSYTIGYSTQNPGQINSIVNTVTGERLSIEGGNWSRFENGIKSEANLTLDEKNTINAVVRGPAGEGATQKGWDIDASGNATGNQVSIPPPSAGSTAPAPASGTGTGTATGNLSTTVHAAASAAVAGLGSNPNPALAGQTAAVAALAAGATGTQASVEAMYFAAQLGGTTEQIRAAGATANFMGGQTGAGLIDNLAANGVEINANLANETGQGLGGTDGASGGINEGIATDAAMGASYAGVAAAYEAYAANPTPENYATLDQAIDGFVDVARESGYNDSSINEAISQATDGNFGESSSTPNDVSGSLDGGGGGGSLDGGGGGSLDGGGSQSFDNVSSTDNSQGSVDSNSNNGQY